MTLLSYNYTVITLTRGEGVRRAAHAGRVIGLLWSFPYHTGSREYCKAELI